MNDALTPKAIVSALDAHIIGQTDAKRAVAVALRNRWRRQQLQHAQYVFTGYRHAPTAVAEVAMEVPAGLRARSASAHPVGAAPRGNKLGGAVLAMNACTAWCMKPHRSTPWRRQVSCTV